MTRRWLWLPGVAGILWILQFVRNAVPPFADLTLSFDGDVALHVVLGDLMLEQGGLLATEPTNYLMEGRPFIAHEWLSELVIALSHRAFGVAGPVLITGALLATLGVLMLRRALKLGAGVWPTVIALVAAFMVQNTHLHPRPHVVTWVLGFLVATWFDRLRTSELDVRGFLLRAVPTVVLWAQLHAGFLIVAPVALAYAGGGVLDALGGGGRAALKRAATFAGLGALLVAASGLNPWGFALHAHFLAWLGNDWMTSFTTEFQSPDFRGMAGYILLFWFGLGVAGLAGAKQRPDASRFLLWAGLGTMALHAARHGAVFATFTLPFVAERLQRAVDGFVGDGTPAGRLFREIQASSARLGEAEAERGGWGTVGLVAAAVVVAVGVARTPEVKWNDSLQPVRASDWIAAHEDELPGRMFNPFRWGAYLAYRLYPDEQVFLNSWHDHLGEEALRTYFRVHDVEADWEQVLADHGVGWVIYETRSELALALDADKDWRRVYQDGTASIWVNKKAAKVAKAQAEQRAATPVPADDAVVAPRPEEVVPALVAWRKAAVDGGAPAAQPACKPGVDLAGMRELPGVPRPEVACLVEVDGPGVSGLHRLWELKFASADDARVALDALLARDDGADPDCETECKALVSGWVEGADVLWLTTRAAGEEAGGCAVLKLADPAGHARGLHRCGR